MIILKKILSNQKGLTFIELMIAIAIIGIISSISVLYIRGNTRDEVERVSNQLAADIRLTRSMAVSKTVYDFTLDASKPQEVKDLGKIYPPGGYGIFINIGANPNTYTIFADSGLGLNPENYNSTYDITIATVSLENSLIKLGDAHKNAIASNNYFTFKSENEAMTDLLQNAYYGTYAIKVYFDNGGYPNTGYQGILNLGEEDSNGLVLVSLGKTFEEYNFAPPPPPPKDPIIKFKIQ